MLRYRAEGCLFHLPQPEADWLAFQLNMYNTDRGNVSWWWGYFMTATEVCEIMCGRGCRHAGG